MAMQDDEYDDEDFEEEYYEEEGDATGGVIPYKNSSALTAYYLGLFSIFPVLGLFLGIGGIILGILGFKKRKEQPAVKGGVHAGIGIGCGLFGLLLNLLIVGSIIAGMIARS